MNQSLNEPVIQFFLQTKENIASTILNELLYFNKLIIKVMNNN